ncbi:hypothetical protein L3Q72_23310 [Vibrio sp. JC009]|uniref:hypothetical protein n=1 Tax=Vibrio sp. JC009 TaxID=2912314 RepID=UPI0023AE9502|nr:hypothetical protein [Vibrio sp. JC009]WED24159.1 hypothetical protein L3Q72_23310 [Vibrio sp. JC009]
MSIVEYSFKKEIPAKLKKSTYNSLSIHEASLDGFYLSKKHSTDDLEIYLKVGTKARLPTIITVDPKIKSKVFIAGNYDNRFKIKIVEGGASIFLGGNTKWCRFSGSLEVKGSSYVVLGRGCSSNDCEIKVSSQSIIIGDDCMFAEGVKIRTHSGHGFLMLDSGDVKTVSSPLLIEPHVWLGQDAKIFLCEYIGACSVVGYGCLVSKRVERFTTVKGSPPIARSMNEKLWLRSFNNRNEELAKKAYYQFILKNNSAL